MEQDQLPPEQQACRERTFLEDLQVLAAEHRKAHQDEHIALYDRIALGLDE